jgi:hypothetical protein
MNKKCPKCNVEISNHGTVVMQFEIGAKIIYFCATCGRQFKLLKNVVDDKYNDNLNQSYCDFIRPERLNEETSKEDAKV